MVAAAPCRGLAAGKPGLAQGGGFCPDPGAFLGSACPISCLCSFDDMDLPSAVKYLMASDPNLQVLGAAYIQHKCYSDAAAKKQVTTPADSLTGPHFSHCSLVPDHPSLIPKLTAQTPSCPELTQQQRGRGGDPHTSAPTCICLHTFTHTYTVCAPELTPACLCPQARSLQAVPRLVKLFNHANQEVQRHATGAMRNLVYDNADNKLALVEENGIFELLRTLREQDDELRKNVTGGPGPRQPPLPLAALPLVLGLGPQPPALPVAYVYLEPASSHRPHVPKPCPPLCCSPVTLRSHSGSPQRGSCVRLKARWGPGTG